MRSLAALVPPPAIAAVAAAAMWGIAAFTPRLSWPPSLRAAIVAALAIVALVFSVGGVVALKRARTTLNPVEPETTSALVGSGIYRVTRNPMYVGLAFFLAAWAAFLSSAFALLGPLAYVLYIDRFQIVPEERALSKLFRAEYEVYRARVRRWL